MNNGLSKETEEGTFLQLEGINLSNQKVFKVNYSLFVHQIVSTSSHNVRMLNE